MIQDEVRALFEYDPETGQLRWRQRSPWHRPDGVVGTRTKRGYLMAWVRLEGQRKSHYVHRLIWLLVYGEWPPMDIDHVNLDKADNRLANLRLATESCNVHNQRARNRVGLKGVWRNRRGWSATITKNRKRIYLGIYDTPELASEAYFEAAKKLHGNFARRL